MPTDLTKLREAWEQESHAEREGYPRDHIVASEAAIDDLARRAYDQAVTDCMDNVRRCLPFPPHDLMTALDALRAGYRGEKGGE